MIPVILECEKYDEHVLKKINTKFSQPVIYFFGLTWEFFVGYDCSLQKKLIFFSNQCLNSNSKGFGNLW
jgi:hypothetical protein